MVKFICIALMALGSFAASGYASLHIESLSHQAFMAGQTAVSWGMVMLGCMLLFSLIFGSKIKG